MRGQKPDVSERGERVADHGIEIDAKPHAPRFLSLPLAQAFFVLSLILGIGLGFWLPFGDLRFAIQILTFLTFVPPFVTLLWFGTGLGALAQWMRLRRAWIDRQN